MNERLTLKGIVGHGIGTKRVKGVDTNEPCVVVFVEKKLPLSEITPENLIPPTIAVWGEEVKTDVLEVGEVKAWMVPADHQMKYRPVIGGISVGPTNMLMAGTIGLPLVYKGDTPCLLSNTHVLAPYWQKFVNPPPGWEEQYGIHVGSNIRQPATLDNGTVDDYIATLLDWATISTTEPNQIDAAIAELTVPANAEILGVNSYPSMAEAQVGDPVYKSGRTTGVTFGQVSTVAVEIQVQYPHGIARMENEIAFLPGGFSAAGDSGSAIVKQANNAIVSLLFAGSDAITIGIPILAVFARFGLALNPATPPEPLEPEPEPPPTPEPPPEPEPEPPPKSKSCREAFMDKLLRRKA